MSCDQAQKLFSRELEGDLESKHRDWLATHLAGCASCTSARERFRAGIDALRTLPRHPVPRRFAEEVVEAATQRRQSRVARPVMAGRWQWAAAILICIALLLVTLVWQEQRWRAWSIEQQDRVSAATREQNRDELLAELKGVSEQLAALAQSVTEQDQQLEVLISGSDQHEAALATSVDQIETERESRQADVEKLERAVAALGERLRTIREDVDGEEVLVALKEQFDSGIAAIERRLREVESGWQRVQPLLAQATSPGSSGVTALDGAPEQEPPTWSSTAPTEPDWPTYAMEDELTDGPCRVLRRDGAVRLHVNWDHPDAIATLFALYRSGAPEEGRLALEELDRLFGPRARRRLAEERKKRGLFDGFLKPSERSEESDEEAKRVEIYEDLWRADRERQP